MALTDEYFSYPHRGHRMDHDLYAWSDLFQRKPVTWPGGARVALWVTPILQWFPFNAPATPFRAPGGLTMPYPDFRHYSSRDYGNRVGIFRILDVLKAYSVPASVALNAAVAIRYPALMRELQQQGVELIAHGLDMGHLHYTGLDPNEESALVERTLAQLQKAGGGQAVRGWLSPGRSQSFNTPRLLAEHGLEYCCDWANDDMPYLMETPGGGLYSMPLAQETDDRAVTLDLHQTEIEWLQQVKDRFDVLYRESAQYGGRIMSLPLHAWVMGVPYRIHVVREALSYMMGHEGVWAATGGQILDAFKASEAAHA